MIEVEKLWQDLKGKLEGIAWPVTLPNGFLGETVLMFTFETGQEPIEFPELDIRGEKIGLPLKFSQDFVDYAKHKASTYSGELIN